MLRLVADRNLRLHILHPNNAMQIPVSIELAVALVVRYSRALKASVTQRNATMREIYF